MFETFYYYITLFVTTFKASRDTALKHSYKFYTIVAVFFNFIWWISFIASCFLLAYNLLGWSFFNFDTKGAFKISSIACFGAFVALGFGMFFERKALKVRTFMGKAFISMLIGTIISGAFGLIISYILEFDIMFMITSILICIQIPYFMAHFIYTLSMTNKNRLFFTDQIDENEFYAAEEKIVKIQRVVLILFEMAMLAFVIYFGAIPYFKNGGLDAIIAKSNEVIKVDKNILFGSSGIVGIAISAIGVLVKIIESLRNKKRN